MLRPLKKLIEVRLGNPDLIPKSVVAKPTIGEKAVNCSFRESEFFGECVNGVKFFHS